MLTSHSTSTPRYTIPHTAHRPYGTPCLTQHIDPTAHHTSHGTPCLTWHTMPHTAHHTSHSTPCLTQHIDPMVHHTSHSTPTLRHTIPHIAHRPYGTLCLTQHTDPMVYSEISNGGHSKIKTLSTKDTAWGPRIFSPYSSNTFDTSQRGQPPYKGQKTVAKCPSFDIPLYLGMA